MSLVHDGDHDDQRLILRWHCQEVALLKNLPLLLETELLADVTLSVCGGQSVKAHKLILAMCSSYFFQLFQELGESGTAATQHPVVVLHDVALEEIQAILAFIYKGSCIVDKVRLHTLLTVAKMLKIQGLCDMKLPEPSIDHQPINVPPEDDYLGHQTSGGQQPISSSSSKRNNNNGKELSETCKCFLCGKYLSNQYNLRVHMETHEEAFHACRACPHVSRSRDALRKHVSYRHPEEYTTRKRKKIT